MTVVRTRTSARWIALHGNLQVPAAVGPFAHFPGLTFALVRDVPERQRRVELPVRAPAAGAARGGPQSGRRPPHVRGDVADRRSGAARVLRRGGRLLRNPFVALAALVSFALMLPEVSFSRDSYSEIPMQVLIFTALWILTDRESFLRPRVALVAGLILGMLQAARIDGLVALLGRRIAVRHHVSRGRRP